MDTFLAMVDQLTSRGLIKSHEKIPTDPIILISSDNEAGVDGSQPATAGQNADEQGAAGQGGAGQGTAGQGAAEHVPAKQAECKSGEADGLDVLAAAAAEAEEEVVCL